MRKNKSGEKISRPSLFDSKSFGSQSQPLSLQRTAAREKNPTKKKTSLPQTILQKPLLIIAGEQSGDQLGREIVLALRSLGFSEFIGTGGDSMASVQVEIIENIEKMTSIGIAEAIKVYRHLKGLDQKLLNRAHSKKIQTAILIDYPGFNLRFAAKLKKAGIRVVHLVSPQIWAWRYFRIHTIKKNVDLMLLLFPFEEDIYKREGITCHWIGHPAVYSIPSRILKEEILPKPLSKNQKRLTVGLLPGSRRSEIKRLLADMLRAAELLHQKFVHCRFLIAGASTQLEPFIQHLLKAHPQLPVEYYRGRSLRIIEASDILVMASGTVALEAAYFKKPMVILYRAGWLSGVMAMILLRVRYFSIVNLLARKQIVPELAQTEVTPQNIVQAVNHLIEDSAYRKTVIEELDFVRKQLGTNNPAMKAARYIVEFLQADQRPHSRHSANM